MVGAVGEETKPVTCWREEVRALVRGMAASAARARVALDVRTIFAVFKERIWLLI
jgi:hypothetical protein